MQLPNVTIYEITPTIGMAVCNPSIEKVERERPGPIVPRQHGVPADDARQARRPVATHVGEGLMGKAGRSPELDRKIEVFDVELDKKRETTCAEAAIEARELGAPQRDCAAYAQIVPATLSNWLARGKAARPDYDKGETIDDVPEDKRDYVDFVERFEAADGTGIVTNLALLKKRAHEGDTRAIRFRVERSRRKEFGNSIDHNISGRIGVSAERERAAKMDDKELDHDLAELDETNGEESP